MFLEANFIGNYQIPVQIQISYYMSLIKQLAKETAIYGISSILVRLLPFIILTPYLTRVFDKGEYGIITDVYTWTALLLIIFTYRMETTFFRFGSEPKDFEISFSTASISILLTTIGFSLIFFLLAPSISVGLLKDIGHLELVYLALIIIGLDAITTIPFARLRLEKRPIRFAAFKTVNILVNIAGVFFFLWLCPRLYEAKLEWVAQIYNPAWKVQYVFLSNLIASLVTLLLFSKMYFKMKWQFDATLWRKMMVYTLPLLVVGIAGIINQLAGNPMIKELATNDFARNFELEGVFGAVTKIAVFMNLYTQAFNYAAEPFFFSNAKRDDARQNYADVAKVFSLVGVLVFLGIWLYIDIIKHFIASKYHGDVNMVPILLLGFLFLGLYYNFSVWYKLTDNTKYGGYIGVAGSIITIGLNFILIPMPEVSYYGPAWSALICYAFMAIAAYWLGRKIFPIPYQMMQIFGYMGLAVVLALVNYWLREALSEKIIWLLTINTILLLAFSGWVYTREKSFLKSLLRK